MKVEDLHGKTWQQVTSLRWNVKPGENLGLANETMETKTLEQAWICIETGEVEWQPVPTRAAK